MNPYLALSLILIALIIGFIAGMVITAMRIVYVLLHHGNIYIGQGWHIILAKKSLSVHPSNPCSES